MPKHLLNTPLRLPTNQVQWEQPVELWCQRGRRQGISRHDEAHDRIREQAAAALYGDQRGHTSGGTNLCRA